MGDEDTPTRRSVLERQKARLLTEVAAVEREIAEIDELEAMASRLGYYITPKPGVAANDFGSDLTITALVGRYLSDPDSPYHSKKFHSRRNTDSLCGLIRLDFGPMPLAEIHAPEILNFYGNAQRRGAERGRGDGSGIAEALVGQLRTLFNYGGRTLNDRECIRLSFLLRDLREPMGIRGVKPRNAGRLITAEETIAIRREAHVKQLASIALAQAFLFDTPFLQRDVIGQWVPEQEPDQSEASGARPILSEGLKWIRGLCWEHISRPGLILHHSAGRVLTPIDFDLRKNAPMVMEEMIRKYASIAGLPLDGPIIVSEESELPYTETVFRRRWLSLAQAANVPVNVSNRRGQASEDSPEDASEDGDNDEVSDWQKAAE